MLADLQAAMRRSLLSLEDDVPAGILADGASAEERFDLYRRSVILSLEHCLADAFPATEDLLGRQWFRPAARAFARHFPPQRPQLSAYGEDFPVFLAANGAFDVQEAAPDLARLEWARLAAYFAEDAPALALDRLAHLSPADTEALRLPLHPSFKLQALFRPVPAVISALTAFGASPMPARAAQPAGSFALRAEGRILFGLADAGEFALLTSLAEGATLLEAADAAATADPATDLQAVLSRHLQLGTFAAPG